MRTTAMNVLSLTRWSAALVASLAAAAGSAWAAPPPTSGIIEYDVQLKRAGQPAQKTVETIYFKGERYRVETPSPRGKSIRIGGPDGTFLLTPGRNEALKLPAPGQRPAIRRPPS